MAGKVTISKKPANLSAVRPTVDKAAKDARAQEVDANSLIDEMGEYPSLDEYMLKQEQLSDEELLKIIEGQRRARALYIAGKG